jgi:hypothetical protein
MTTRSTTGLRSIGPAVGLGSERDNQYEDRSLRAYTRRQPWRGAGHALPPAKSRQPCANPACLEGRTHDYRTYELLSRWRQRDGMSGFRHSTAPPEGGLA